MMHRYLDREHPLFVEALTHSSYTILNPHAGPHNEVLEFFGDAVLQLCVTDLLGTLFPTEREGELTRMRHQLVDTGTLAEIGRELELGPLIRMSVGEERQGARTRDKMLANVVEAILGAIYKVKGLETCQEIVRHHFTERAKQAYHQRPAKQSLSEWCQKIHGTPPIYRLVEEQGPSHASIFVMGVWIDGEQIAQGEGTSKKSATIEAAKQAVQRLRQQGAISE